MLLDRLKAKFNKSESREAKRGKGALTPGDKNKKKEVVKNDGIFTSQENDIEKGPTDLASSLLTEMNNPETEEESAVLEAIIQPEQLIKGVIITKSDPDSPDQLIKDVITTKGDSDNPEQLIKGAISTKSESDKSKVDKGSLDDLFREDESASDTPMRRFIAQLPDVTCQELSEDIQRVNELFVQVSESRKRKPDKGGA